MEKLSHITDNNTNLYTQTYDGGIQQRKREKRGGSIAFKKKCF